MFISNKNELNLSVLVKAVLQEDDDENNGGNEEQIEKVEIDKKAPIAISGDNVYIVWFNDQNTPEQQF